MRTQQDARGAGAFVPVHAGIARLKEAVQQCQGCELYRHATQAVLGEGPRQARIVMVGEQPGDREDREGRPFVGPAGALLDRALEEAGIARDEVYVTNAVKHFKFEERGKRRIHKRPSDTEIRACLPWLDAELEAVHPVLIVCLGASAARAVLGKDHRLLAERGRFFAHPMAAGATATVHPSAILRAPNSERRHEAFRAFVQDLIAVRRRLEGTASAA